MDDDCLKPDIFFSVQHYEHKELFQIDQPVWNSLVKLPKYFTTIRLGVQYGTLPKSCYLINPSLIFIGKNTRIDPGVYIEGPCYIGEDCEIRHGACLRPYSLIGNGCIVGHCTEVKSSILLDEVKVPHFNYVGDSVLGNNVHLGAGVILANCRLDHQKIDVIVQGQRKPSELHKFGAIIGDGSSLGCNSVVNPGILLGRNFTCYPGTMVRHSLVPSEVIL